jgi:hypothetical protein
MSCLPPLPARVPSFKRLVRQSCPVHPVHKIWRCKASRPHFRRIGRRAVSCEKIVTWRGTAPGSDYARFSRAMVWMPIAVRPMAIPRCSTRPSRCRRLRSLSATVPARMPPALAIWIKAIASCGLNSTSGLRSTSSSRLYAVRVRPQGADGKCQVRAIARRRGRRPPPLSLWPIPGSSRGIPRPGSSRSGRRPGRMRRTSHGCV